MSLSEDDLVDSRAFLSQIGAWPTPRRLNIAGWIENFPNGQDREVALALLESMVHLNEEEVRHCAVSTFRALSARPEFGSATDRQALWTQFITDALVSFPSGGSSDPAGSGHIFVRIMREAGMDEDNIFTSDDLVREVATRTEPVPVVLMDDLTASGDQFCRNWKRSVTTSIGTASLRSLVNEGRISRAYYVPIVATVDALNKIASRVPEVEVSPAYTIGDEYKANSIDTQLVPVELRPLLDPFAQKFAADSGNAEHGHWGYGEIGLAISFHHSTPNNTLPVLRGKTARSHQDWKPLIQ